MPQILEVVKKSVMGDSLGTCGGPWCVRGPHDGTGDEASLILTPTPLSLDLHPGFTHFYLFAHSHHIHSFFGLIAPHPQGTLTCEACQQPPAHPSRPPLVRQISKTRRYTNVACCLDMLNAIVSARTRGPWRGGLPPTLSIVSNPSTLQVEPLALLR